MANTTPLVDDCGLARAGTETQRPSNPPHGFVWFNSTTQQLEVFDATTTPAEWVVIGP